MKKLMPAKNPERSRTGLFAATTATASLFLVLIVAPANADSPDHAAVQTIAAIEAVSPELISAAVDVMPQELGDTAIEADTGDVRISVQADPAEPLRLESDDSLVSVELPAATEASDAVVAGEWVVVFDNNDGSAAAPIVRVDGSYRSTP